MYTYINIYTGRKIVTPCKVSGDWELVSGPKAPKQEKVEAVEEPKEEKKTTKKKK